MQTLYPIIRRVRRPLVVAVAVTETKPPVVVPPVEPVPPVAETVREIEPPTSEHEKISGKRNAR